MMLEDLGHRVIEAHSGAAALEILKTTPAVDMLLTDHAMPEMTGMELADRVRELRPGLPILLATGYADLLNSAHVELPRLAKPYGQKQLANELARLLARRACNTLDGHELGPTGQLCSKVRPSLSSTCTSRGAGAAAVKEKVNDGSSDSAMSPSISSTGVSPSLTLTSRT